MQVKWLKRREIGKPSTTIASIVGRNNLYLLWDLMPVTGRSHQLRYEMYRHHVPIVGDELYGSTIKYPIGIALRSYQLDLSNSPELLKMGLPSEIKINGISLPTN
jgi:tRNA pseudouridine32 synthase/23S rRNA pseudouridine746 synthase